MNEQASVIEHYGHAGLAEKLAAALATAGFADKRLSPADLAPLDQFHTRGMAATVELAAALAIAPGASVIDIGSGLGGPSRYLAAKYGCTVKGIDLSPAFVDAAAYLAQRCGLADQVSYDCADALALPYPDGSFDIAWTQHVAMNIADRTGLYGEVHRVLKPGGRLAIYDVVLGSGGPIHYPVPWSRSPDTSFVATAEAMRSALETGRLQGHAVGRPYRPGRRLVRRTTTVARRGPGRRSTGRPASAWPAHRHGLRLPHPVGQSRPQSQGRPRRNSSGHRRASIAAGTCGRIPQDFLADLRLSLQTQRGAVGCTEAGAREPGSLVILCASAGFEIVVAIRLAHDCAIRANCIRQLAISGVDRRASVQLRRERGRSALRRDLHPQQARCGPLGLLLCGRR